MKIFKTYQYKGRIAFSLHLRAHPFMNDIDSTLPKAVFQHLVPEINSLSKRYISSEGEGKELLDSIANNIQNHEQSQEFFFPVFLIEEDNTISPIVLHSILKKQKGVMMIPRNAWYCKENYPITFFALKSKFFEQRLLKGSTFIKSLKPAKTIVLEKALTSTREREFYVDVYHKKNEVFTLGKGVHAFAVLFSQDFEILMFKKL